MQERKNAEFHIGATVFSIVGAVFILIGLIIFGVNYLDEFVMQLMMYVIGLAVICLSELLIKRLSVSFSNVITSIGLGVLFVPTLSNSVLRDLLEGVVAITIAFIVGIGGIFLGKYKDSVLVRIINIVGAFSVFVVNGAMKTELKMMVVATLFLIFGIVNLLLANKRYNQVLVPVQMTLTFFYLIYMVASSKINHIYDMYVIFGIVAIFIICEFGSLAAEKRNEIVANVFTVVISFIDLFVLCIKCITIHEDDVVFAYSTICKIVGLCLVVAICGLVYALSDHSKFNSKLQVYMICASVLFMAIRCKGLAETLIVLIGVIALSFFGRNKDYAILDSAFSTIAGLALICSNMTEKWYISLLCLLVYLAGIFIYKYNYVFNELMSMVYVTVFSAMMFDEIFDYFTEIRFTEGICFLVTTLMILYFVFISKREKHDQSLLIIIGFIIQAGIFIGVISINVYDVFFRTTYEIEGLLISSLLIMLSVVLYIVFGFTKNKPYFRVAGLIYAGLVCAKLILMDMHNVEPMFKILAFIGAGIIALIISMIYIKFDKKDSAESALNTTETENVPFSNVNNYSENNNE